MTSRTLYSGSDQKRDATMQIGPWEVDLDSGVLTKQRVKRTLTPRTLLVLRRLVAEPGQLIRSQVLLDALWRGPLSADNALQKSISELRRAFGDNAQTSEYIRTVRKQGYVLIAPVAGIGVADRNDKVVDTPALPGAPSAGDLIRVEQLVSSARIELQSPTSASVGRAEDLLQRALTDNPESTAALGLMVRVWLHRADFGESWWQFSERAYSLTARAEAIDGQSAEVLVTKSLLLIRRSREQEAIELLNRVLAAEPANEAARLLLATTLHELGRFTQAREMMLSLIEAVPFSPTVNMLLAEASAYAGYLTDAQHYFERATTLGPDDPDILLRAGNFNIWINSDYAAALDQYFRAREIDRNDIRPPTRIMSLMLFVDLPDEMHRWRRIAEAINPNNHALAFWRMPGAEYSFDKRRRYVQHQRELEPDERDWLRASGELEMELVALSSSQGARETCVRRAFSAFRQYLIDGGDLELDKEGVPVRVCSRAHETLAFAYLIIAGLELGECELVRAVLELRIREEHGNARVAEQPLQQMRLFMANALLGNRRVALRHLERIGPQCPKLLTLTGATDEQSAIWDRIATEPRFVHALKTSLGQLSVAREEVAQRLPPLLDREVNGQRFEIV